MAFGASSNTPNAYVNETNAINVATQQQADTLNYLLLGRMCNAELTLFSSFVRYEISIPGNYVMF